MVDPLLALCSRAVSHPEQRRQLVIQAHNYDDWSTLPHRAESLGIAPLASNHLQAANIEVRKDSSLTLTALTLRHRRANRIRTYVLAEILATFKEEDIEVLVLKGAALAHSVYPQPGLRPMRDIDILVKQGDALRAQTLLVDMGFQANIPESLDEIAIHHLPIAQRMEDGLKVSVEVHYYLLPYDDQAYEYEDLVTRAISFSANGTAAQTLGNEDMLWHIYRHSFAYPLIAEPIRLISVADFVSLVEKHIDEIDWDFVQVQYRQIWQMIPVFHYLTPWSENVINRLNIDTASPPGGVGDTFMGWPQSSLASQRKKGLRRFLGDTFWPSEWWTWLYYGVGRRTVKWWWIRLVRHPLHICGWVLQYLRKR